MSRSVGCVADVVIDPRYRGPPESANGGYACAMAAQFIEGPAEVTLLAPPPLSTPLSVDRRDDGTVGLLDGETLVAQARATTVGRDIPEPVTVDEARNAATRFAWLEDHAYPSCFVCGPDRTAGDGLRVFSGPVEGRKLHAAPWEPDATLGDADGFVRPEYVWSVLDCPSGIVTDHFGDVGTMLLGRLAADLIEPLRVGTTYVVTAWPMAREGRKLDTGSALFTAEGDLVAVARARWIELSRPRGPKTRAGGQAGPR